MSKDLMLHISEFHVQQYADKGGFPLSRKFTLKLKIMYERHEINVKVATAANRS